MTYNVLTFIVGFTLYGTTMFCQRTFTISRVDDAIIIDGILDEKVWQESNVLDSFLNQWPIDTGLAKAQTLVRLAYDDHFLYVAAECLDFSNNHVVRTLKRDQEREHFGSDGFGLVLDPTYNRSNGFFFGANAGGAQLEGLVQVNGTSSELDLNWDNIWYCEVGKGDNVWYFEAAIPFNTLRYDPENDFWGINFVRNDMKSNVFSSWNSVPVNLNTIDLGYVGKLQWKQGPPRASNRSYSLLPYTLLSSRKEYTQDKALKAEVNLGLEAKIRVTESLNLDLSLNPDFSTVDVDVQQINLTRFDLFFPERRTFFQENSDLFTSFGLNDINPFFSRRIGLSNGQKIPILLGARLTGNLTDRLRIGAMNIQTRDNDISNKQNFGVFALQHRLGQRSFFKGMLVNRQFTGSEVDANQLDYNRVGAVELNLLSGDGKVGADVGIHKSMNPGNLSNEQYLYGTILYTSKNIIGRFGVHSVGENYITDVGFVPRLNNYDAIRDTTVRQGFFRTRGLILYNYYPNEGPINLHGPRFSTNIYHNPDGDITSIFSGVYYWFDFRNQHQLEFSLVWQVENLPYESFIAGAVPFPKDEYNFGYIGVYYRTDPRKYISHSADIRYGSFYSGNRLYSKIGTSFLIQPWGNLGLSYTYIDISLPETLESTKLYLAGLTNEISFSNAIFWTTFIQYNTQSNNLNINSRFQWRFRPLSDLFIVYSENYLSDSFNIKDRSLVLKATYWY